MSIIKSWKENYLDHHAQVGKAPNPLMEEQRRGAFKERQINELTAALAAANQKAEAMSVAHAEAVAKIGAQAAELLSMRNPPPSPQQKDVTAGDADALRIQAINALLDVATAAYDAMDNTEERASSTGDEDAEYVVPGAWFDALSGAMDKIDALPDDQPGMTTTGGARASWALRGLFDVCAQMRALCENCGGTGDVTLPDGEYLGRCNCEHAKALAMPTVCPCREGANPRRDCAVCAERGLSGSAA